MSGRTSHGQVETGEGKRSGCTGGIDTQDVGAGGSIKVELDRSEEEVAVVRRWRKRGEDSYCHAARTNISHGVLIRLCLRSGKETVPSVGRVNKPK